MRLTGPMETKAFEHKTWPICDGCKQSCTGSYVGKARCHRCPDKRTLGQSTEVSP